MQFAPQPPPVWDDPLMVAVPARHPLLAYALPCTKARTSPGSVRLILSCSAVMETGSAGLALAAVGDNAIADFIRLGKTYVAEVAMQPLDLVRQRNLG